MSKLGISLVLATIGRVEEIGRFVREISRQTSNSFELIIVDQNQDDRLTELVSTARGLGITTTHLKQEEPNLCAARNYGITHARFELVGFPDDDCWYEVDTVQKVIEAFAARPLMQGLVGRWEEQGYASTVSCSLSHENWSSFKGVPASSITQFYRKQLLTEFCGFDARLGLHSWYGSGEETDLIFRALENSRVIEYHPCVKVHHHFGSIDASTPMRIGFLRSRKRARGTGALYAKHRLSKWVIVRGMLAPCVRALVSRSSQTIAKEVGTSLGRIEGYIGWRFGWFR